MNLSTRLERLEAQSGTGAPAIESICVVAMMAKDGKAHPTASLGLARCYKKHVGGAVEEELWRDDEESEEAFEARARAQFEATRRGRLFRWALFQLTPEERAARSFVCETNHDNQRARARFQCRSKR